LSRNPSAHRGFILSRPRQVSDAFLVRGHGRVPIARFATRNRPDDRGSAAPPHRDDRADAPAGRSQEELWAACLAERPELIADIVNFIAEARTRVVESPPVAPSDDEPKPEPSERTRRK